MTGARPEHPGISKRLREARLAAGLTPAELSAAVGYDDGGQKIRDLESRKARALPNGDMLLALARALNCSMDWLATGDGEGPRTREPDALERHIAAMVHRYQAQVEAGANEPTLQEYWELLVHAFKVNEQRFLSVEDKARTMARIAAGMTPTTPTAAERVRTNQHGHRS